MQIMLIIQLYLSAAAYHATYYTLQVSQPVICLKTHIKVAMRLLLFAIHALECKKGSAISWRCVVLFKTVLELFQHLIFF